MEEAANFDNGTKLSARALRALDNTDAMPRALRECVHEFGYEIVEEFCQAGVRNPTTIRRLVHAAWCGARAPAQRTGSKNSHISPVLRHLDWLLIQSGAAITAKTLLRELKQHGLFVVPHFPNKAMVDASLAYTRTVGTVSKTEKHCGRIDAALKAAAKSMWPFLFEDGK